MNATKPCTNGDVRLAGVLSSNQGRVEICYNNQWGTVCDNSFTNVDARVVCRQLGFPAIGEPVQNITGSDPILIIIIAHRSKLYTPSSTLVYKSRMSEAHACTAILTQVL